MSRFTHINKNQNRRENPPMEAQITADQIRENIIANLREVYDPEIPVNIYDLGLIYEITVDEDDHTAHLLMTLTAPNCPAAGILPGQAENAARNAEGVVDAEVELTFDPPFTPDMMSDEAKLQLGFM